MRDSMLSPTKVEGRGLFENPGLMKQFTNIGSISGNGQTTPELIAYTRCLPQEVGM